MSQKKNPPPPPLRWPGSGGANLQAKAGPEGLRSSPIRPVQPPCPVPRPVPPPPVVFRTAVQPRLAVPSSRVQPPPLARPRFLPVPPPVAQARILPAPAVVTARVVQRQKMSENHLDTLIPKVKTHIRKFVREAYGEASDNPKIEDTLAEQLNFHQTPETRNCGSVITWRHSDMIGISYNSNKVKHTTSFMQSIGTKNEFEDFHQSQYFNTNSFYGLTDNCEHAEMKQIDQLGVRHLDKIRYIGISQPCCMMCAAVMASLGLADKTRGYHIKGVKNWKWPQFVLNYKRFLWPILGYDATMAIGEDSDKLQQVLHRITTSVDTQWD